jgi:hypothetical protein
MKKGYVKKGLAVSIICILMLVSFPMITGKEIIYLREEGPYNVFASGEINTMAGNLSTIFRIMPFWFLSYPRHIEYWFEGDSVLFINGEKQDIVYPARVDLIGFKGFGQTFHMWMFKIFASNLIYFITDYLMTPKARVFGQCDEIIVNDA